MVYVVANLYLFHGLLHFIFKNGNSVSKELAYQNGDQIAKAGKLKHPKERVRMLGRMTNELGLTKEEDNHYFLTELGKQYASKMPDDIWSVTKEQAEFLNELIFEERKDTRLAQTIIKGYELLKEQESINPIEKKDEFAELIDRQDWDSITRQEKFKFVLNYLVDMRLATRSKGEYRLIDVQISSLNNISIFCDKVQKRPSPEIQSLVDGQSIVIVKNSTITRNTLLYPAHSSHPASDFKDSEKAQKAIDESMGEQIILGPFIYLVKKYKLKNKPELAKFTAEFQPWTEEVVNNWRKGKSNIIVAILRAYKTNPLVTKPIGNMGVVPLSEPAEVTSLTPILSDEEFEVKVLEVEEALKKYDLVEEEKQAKSVFKMAPGENAEFWGECIEKGIISGEWKPAGDFRKYRSKAEVKAEFDARSKSPNAIWTLYKAMNIGDILVANKGKNQVVGVGKITSDYIYDPSRSRFKQVRMVDWIITEPVDVSFNFPIETISNHSPGKMGANKRQLHG